MYLVGTCESAVCVRIESQIELGIKILIESSNRIFSTPSPTNINYIIIKISNGVIPVMVF